MVWEGAGLFSPSLFLQSCHFQTAERILLILEQELLDRRPPFHFPPSCLHLLVERKDFCFPEQRVEREKLVEKCRPW
jgi:hypothetical protein